MKLNKYLIIIGSNTDREKNIDLATRSIENVSDNVFFGRTVETEPVNMPNSQTFLNKGIVMFSDIDVEELNSICKEIEKKAGRTPEDKKQGIIKLDVDIVIANNEILKPGDLEREYAHEFEEEYYKYAESI